MAAAWTIGADPECDLVVDQPTVSRRHCRLVSDIDGYTLEDLGSSNGTYVNGQRISGRVRVTKGDSITLGMNVPLPWPSDLPARAPTPAPTATAAATTPSLTFRGETMIIGRDAECDVAIAAPVVSGRHARVSRSGDQVVLEDLGSSNGTFLNGRRIERAEPLRPGDVIGLGSYTLTFADASPARLVRAPADVDAAPAVVRPVEVRPGPAAAGGALPQPWVMLALIGQVVPLSLAIAMLRGPEVVLFWLALAAVWFGLSSAVLTSTSGSGLRGVAGRPGGAASLVPRLGGLAVLCLFQSVLAWVIVSAMAHLQGAAVPQVMLLALASGVGMALGLTIVLALRAPAASWLLLVPILLTLWTLGGQHWPVPAMSGWARVLSNATPTRWAFEGLLLLESGEGGAKAEPAERYFPASSDRMGVGADAAALAAMLIGLTALAAFAAEESRRGAPGLSSSDA